MYAPTLFSLNLPELITPFSVETLEPFSAMVIAWRKMMSSLLMAERRNVQGRKARQKRAHLRAAAPLNR